MVGCTAMLCSSVCVLHERSPWLAVLPCFARVCVSCMSGHLGWLYCHALLERVCLACAVSLVGCTVMLCSSVCVLHERSPWLVALPCFARVCVSCMSSHLGWLYCHALLECVCHLYGLLSWLNCLVFVFVFLFFCFFVFCFFVFLFFCFFVFCVFCLFVSLFVSLSLSSFFVICSCLCMLSIRFVCNF